MSRTRKVLLVTAFVLLIMALLFGCARLFWDTTGQSGWYIRLNIGDVGAKAIGVGEYDVTRVEVELFAPEESLPFYTITWYAGDDPVSELIPVSEQGQYRIEVTHVGDDNGEPVEAKEWANFNIAAMVITVINVTPGAVGVIEVEPGEIVPEEPIDLTGYWDWFFTPDCPPEEPDCEPEELGPITLGIQQTNSTLVTDLMDFSGSISGSIFNLNSVEVDTHLTGTVSGSGDEIEITGTFTSDVLGGSGIFRIVPTAATFGTLSAEGTVDGVDINIDTEFALGNGGETDVRYNYSFPLTADWFSGHVSLQTINELTTKTYTVVDHEPWEDDEISVSLWPYSGGEIYAVENENLEQVTITKYDSSGIAGTFDLELNNGSTLEFTISNSTPIAVFEDPWYTVHFEVDGWDPLWVPDGVYLMLWFSVDVEDESGHVLTERTYTSQPPGEEGDHWWFTPDWSSPSGSLEEFHIDNPGTLNISRFDRDGIGNDDGIEGTFNTSGAWGWLNGEFTVYFYDEWEPEGD
jgi:hypothetical protein